MEFCSMPEIELPLVSVIVPLYNRKKFLPQLFNTLMQQSYKNFELILIDDGSTDNTEAWLEQNKHQIPQKTTYAKQENAGPYAARNHGLSLAQGKYIAFQDSDDEWPNYHIGEFVDALEKNDDIDWLFGSLQRINHLSREIMEESNFYRKHGERQPFVCLITETRKELQVISDSNAGATAIQYCVPGSTQCAMIRKTLFDKNLFDASFRTAYDRFFAMKCVLMGYKFAFVNKVHQIYHIHDEHISLVAGADAEKLERSAKTMLRGYTSLLKVTKTNEEIKAINQQLARVNAWELSIAYRNMKKFSLSTKAMFNAFKLNPSEWLYTKSLITSIIRQLLN